MSRDSLRIFILTVLCAALSVTAFARTSAARSQSGGLKPLVSLPAGPRDTVQPAAKTAGQRPQAHPAQSNSINLNPTILFTSPFAHDYNEGGMYGDYGVGVTVHGDFRHQGVQDIATLSTDGILTLMTNDGKGNFTNAYKNLSQTAQWVNINTAFAVDLNGDGWLDVLALDSYQPGQAGYVVWLNNGDGTFKDAVRTPVDFPSGAAPGGSYIRPNGMAIGDLDGDGKTDIMLTFSASDYMDNIYLMYLAGLKGNGDGTFQSAVFGSSLAFTQQTYMGGIALADMDKDGKLDVVAKFLTGGGYGQNGAEAYGVAPGTGSVTPGKWTMPPDAMWTDASVTRGGGFIVKDLDGDGNLDVLSVPGTYSVNLYRGDGAGNLSSPQQVIALDTLAYSATMGDFNNDGYLDAAVFSDGVVRIYDGAANGSFANTFSQEYPGGMAGTTSEAAFDMNGDGVDDFIWAESMFNTLFSYRNNGDGTFNSYTALRPANISDTAPNNAQTSMGFMAIAKGDFNGDGLTDLLVQDGTSYLDVALNNGKDGFVFTRSIDGTKAGSLGLDVIEPLHRDLDGDGFDDVLFVNSSGVVSALSDGKGGFKNFLTSPLPMILACSPGSADAADLDGDGNLDVVIAYAGDASCYANTVTTPSGYFVLKGDGKGGFTGSFFPAGNSVYSAELADLNGDGRKDIVLADSSYPFSYIDVVPGDGTIAPPISKLTAIYTSPMMYEIAGFTLADANADNIPDLTVSEYYRYNTLQSDISLMAGNGDFTFKAAQPILSGDFAVAMEYGDMNHDGHADLVAVLQPNSMKLNGLAILRGNGDGSFQTPDIYPAPLDSTPHFNELLLTGAYHKAGTHDVLLGGGSGYVPSALYFNAESAALSLSANRSTANLGDDVSLYAQMGDFAGNNATGTVDFSSNGVSIGSATINGKLATLTVNSLPVGDNKIMASYAGDATHAATQSGLLDITIVAANSDFTLAGSAPSINLTTGSTAQISLTLVANSSMTAAVQFSCLGLPATLQCSFAPASLNLTPSTTQSATLTLATTQTTAKNRASSALPVAVAASALCLPLLIGKRRRSLFFCLVLLPLGMMHLLTGCGSGSHALKAPMTYNFTVVAQATTNGGTLTHSIPVQVTAP